jgi:hypothetical protein
MLSPLPLGFSLVLSPSYEREYGGGTLMANRHSLPLPLANTPYGPLLMKGRGEGEREGRKKEGGIFY